MEDHRNILNKSHHQLCDNFRCRKQQFGCVVVDQSGDIRDDFRHILNKRRQTCNQSIHKVHDQIDTGIHQHSEVLPDGTAEVGKHWHRLSQQLRYALRQTLTKLLNHCNAALDQLWHARHQTRLDFGD